MNIYIYYFIIIIIYFIDSYYIIIRIVSLALQYKTAVATRPPALCGELSHVPSQCGLLKYKFYYNK